MTDAPDTDVTADGETAAEPIIAQPVADQYEAMTDDELRAFIKARDGKFPHAKTGREKLLIAVRGDVAASTEIESDPVVEGTAQAEPVAEPVAEAEPPAESEAEPVVEEAEAEAKDEPAAEPVVVNPAVAAAARDAVELRVSELINFLQGEIQHFPGGVDQVCALIADRLKAAL